MVNISTTNPYYNTTYRISNVGKIGNEDATEDEFIENCKANIGGGHPITFTDENGTFVSITADKFASVEIWKPRF